MSRLDDAIWIVEEDTSKSSIGNKKRALVDATSVKSQMRELLRVVSAMFDQADELRGMKLSEVELTVEINAEGQVSLVSAGSKTASRGAITLRFTRSDLQDS
ncbi:MAG: hypothetical protein AAGD09_15765 [Cyanobacteria bacterium P01_F01_bin.56]